jgi:membrane protein implicated in regulation of membrane protease activity
MMEWWNGLSGINQAFFAGAAFFSVFFLWQLVAMLLGMAGGDEAELSHDHDGGAGGHAGADGHAAEAQAGEHGAAHDGHHDAAHSVFAFKLLSVRSVLAFFTVFSWAGALYLMDGTSLSMALLLALVWGAVAMLAVSGLMSLVLKLTETGTTQIKSCVGTEGTVYIDIPAGGEGEARVFCRGVMSVLRARSADGTPIKSGTPVVVTRMLGANVIQVKPAEPAAPPKA